MQVGDGILFPHLHKVLDVNSNYMDTVLMALISATVMGAIVSALLNLLFKSKLERIATDIKNQSDRISTIFKSQYTWREQSLSELLGPINMLLNRTEGHLED